MRLGRQATRERVGKGFHAAMTFAERALAVDCGLHVLLMNPLQLASFVKICMM